MGKSQQLMTPIRSIYLQISKSDFARDTTAQSYSILVYFLPASHPLRDLLELRG